MVTGSHPVVASSTTLQKDQKSNHKKKRRPSLPDNDNHDSSDNKRARTTSTSILSEMSIMSSSTTIPWGDWMGAWKVGTDQVDHEAERIDRQKAAFGHETVARLKDINVLILGCRGVGVETAKNLILSNVGSVLLWDPTPCKMADRGTNFYIQDAHVVHNDDAAGNNNNTNNIMTRAQASLAELQTLNPFCRVDVLETTNESIITDDILLMDNVLGTKHGLTAVVVTDLMMIGTSSSSRDDNDDELIFHINETCRNNNIAFIMALNHGGVTCSVFSDFGLHHEITDATGEPTQTLAVSNVEILDKKPKLLEIDGIHDEDDERVIIVTVAQGADHGLDDDDVVALDDMHDAMSALNGYQVKVKRVAIVSPTDAKVDSSGVVFKEALKLPTSSVVENFDRQYQFFKQQHDDKKNADNNNKFRVRSITMFNRLALMLSDEDLSKAGITIDALRSYQSGGLLNQVRPPIVKSYKSLKETLEYTPVPQMLRGDEWEAGGGIEVHLCIAAVLEFHASEKRWPGIHDVNDAKKVVALAKFISESRKTKEGACWLQTVQYGFPSGEARDINEERVARYSRLFQTELTGFCAFLGGAAAQEVLKASGKFTPIDQWVHHDEPALVADECPSNLQPLFGSRYDYQIAVMGKDFQARAANQRVFLVGCGALGCEYLKGLSLMGVGTGRDGFIKVTDMDRIEVSNLSRQFLFRQHDVGHPKSVRGALAVKKWNPRLNIEALERKVGPDTEDFFDDKFWESLDVCWNALDNVQARQYTDSRCLFYSKPLLESGTLGTKCNHEVVLPYRTSTYNDGNENDENENQIAMCTLRSFPYLPKHCIEYAKQAYFSDYFEFGPDQYETFRGDTAAFFEQLDSMDPGEQLKSLRMIKFFLDLQKEAGGGGTIDFAACVRVAFNRMIEDFRTSILNLCHSADEMERSSGKKFWTGTKRRPRAVDWTKNPVPELMEYLYCTSNMYASIWNVDVVRDRAEFETIVANLNLEQPAWTPSTENVDLSEGDDDAAGGDSGDEVEKLKADLYSVDVSGLPPARPQDFEKDDDCNFHVDFLTVSTNLRSWNYDIKASPRHTVKVTAGRIIPALATTTAMVCGLVDIEFCKLVLGLQSLGRDKFLNSNINLAAGSGNFTTFCPDPPVPISTGLVSPQPETFTSWDKIEIAAAGSGGEGGELSVEQLVKYIEKSFGVSVIRIFQYGGTEDKALYNAVDKQKLDWDITIDNEGSTVTVSDGVFALWPQLRMAVQMLGRLPPTSGQRKIFVSQVENVKRALDHAKESFTRTFTGPVTAAYRSTYRPSSEEKEKQQYFDTVLGARDYITLGIDCCIGSEEDITLPPIKYMFSSSADGGE